MTVVRFLTFTLYAPMCSCGEIAVGERRMSWSRPGRSAVLGLVAAAKGILRSDRAGHDDLESGLYYAVCTVAPGRPFVDYHTTQSGRPGSGQAFRTRREELQAPNIHTVLSFREWRSDTLFRVALWKRPGSSANLAELLDALRSPAFVLYLGRKSAPLGLPLDPQITEADDVRGALVARRTNPEESALLEKIGHERGQLVQLACDADAPGVVGSSRQERRRDSVVSRERWQFADRLERVWEVDAR